MPGGVNYSGQERVQNYGSYHSIRQNAGCWAVQPQAPQRHPGRGCCYAGSSVVRRGGARRYRRHPHWQKQQYPGQRRAAHRAKPGVTIGKNVVHRPASAVHGCIGGDGALIGMHATVMNGAVVGKNAVVAAGALVLENTVIPDGMVAMGVPGVRSCQPCPVEAN